MVTVLHDGSLYCFCLLAKSYETINQSLFRLTDFSDRSRQVEIQAFVEMQSSHSITDLRTEINPRTPPVAVKCNQYLLCFVRSYPRIPAQPRSLWLVRQLLHLRAVRNLRSGNVSLLFSNMLAMVGKNAFTSQ